jgi:magnesium transporter
MELRLFVVNEDNLVERIPVKPPTAAWLEDRRVRWLDIEAAPDPLLAKLLAPLGIGPSLLRRYHDTCTASEFVERSNMIVFTHPMPSTWKEETAQVHIVCIGNLLITFHAEEVKDFEEWFFKWLQEWPLAGPTLAAMLQRLLESLAEIDKAAYLTLRQHVARLAEAVKEQGADFDVQQVEEAMTTVHRINTFFFDQGLIYATLQGVRSKALILGDEARRFRLAATAAEDIRHGTTQLQRRIENLHQQHMLDVQALTDRNLRVLTVVSAVFLPLTLISGIYGMNFENMPELDEEHMYFTILGIMATIAVGMFGFFYWKGWLK